MCGYKWGTANIQLVKLVVNNGWNNSTWMKFCCLMLLYLHASKLNFIENLLVVWIYVFILCISLLLVFIARFLLYQYIIAVSTKPRTKSHVIKRVCTLVFMWLPLCKQKGVIKCIASFMNRSKESKKEIHILYEIFVLCIIYCMPQNSGGKCVLTENIVKISAKIYDAIEPEELWLKIIRSIRDSFFCRRHSLPFHWIRLAYRKHRKAEGKFMNMPAAKRTKKCISR